MSKKVYLRRKDLMNHLPKELRASAVMKLSSVYVNRQPLKGFDPKDEKKYLNGILDVEPGHVEWPKHSKRYWSDLTIPVGFEGVELEVGLDEEGNPLSIMDYIKYRFALRHPHVAMSKDEMTKEFGKRFYIHDPLKDITTRNNTIQLKKDADKAFIQVSGKSDKMIWMLRLLSNTVRPETLTETQIENYLYDIKESEPKRFLKIASDKNLEVKAEIEAMVSAGVLRKIGNQIIFIDEILGDTMEDTVIHLKDKKNSGKLTILRAKLKELAS